MLWGSLKMKKYPSSQENLRAKGEKQSQTRIEKAKVNN